MPRPGHGPEPSDVERLRHAAETLQAIAAPAAIAILRSLADCPVVDGDPSRLLERAGDQAGEQLRRLVAAGLVAWDAPPVHALRWLRLTKRGREAWHAARAILE